MFKVNLNKELEEAHKQWEDDRKIVIKNLKNLKKELNQQIPCPECRAYYTTIIEMTIEFIKGCNM